eukprot:TRINITY_DN970_c1_g2_i1.p1 TRINITY_DN970_c1_g2~~TRINITY_DN970_c1_g2_i1.p1  ORF type:complete len:429 (+),score=61.46 TRINITY_DN970_c1_g2_i1:59-1288(+)
MVTLFLCLLTFGVRLGHVASARTVDVSASADSIKMWNGMVWQMQVVPNHWCINALPDEAEKEYRDLLCLDGKIKARRSIPTVKQEELLHMLDANGVISAPTPTGINGWDGLKHVQLQSLDCEGVLKWHLARTDATNEVSTILKKADCASPLQARIVGEEWTKTGWREGNDGFVFWWHPPDASKEGTLTYGRELADQVVDPSASVEHVVVIAHRVPAPRHGFFDFLTKLKYVLLRHYFLVVQWKNLQYVTVFEVDKLSNRLQEIEWVMDHVSNYREQVPDAMKTPISRDVSYIRAFDMVLDMGGFMEHVKNLAKQPKSFIVSPQVIAEVKEDSITEPLSRRDIALALTNYITSDNRYDLYSKNCQTFVADLYNKLTGRTIKCQVYVTHKNGTHRFDSPGSSRSSSSQAGF